MIKRIGTRLILSAAIILTLVQTLPRTYYSRVPPGINPGGLQGAISKLHALRHYDTLYLALDSHGGSVDELTRFMKARNATKGTLICTVETISASASAMILQSCDKVYVRPHAQILYHMPRFMNSEKTPYGKKLEIHIISRKSKKFLMQLQYIYFKAKMEQFKIHETLTEQEWNKLLDGEDIIISGKELAKRDKRVRVL